MHDNHRAAEVLVNVAAGSDAEISTAIDAIGFPAAAHYLLGELTERCNQVTVPTRTAVHLSVGWTTRNHDHGFVFDDKGMTAVAGTPEDPQVRIEIPVADLTRLLLAPERLRGTAQWRHRMLPEFPELATDNGAAALAGKIDPIGCVGKATQAILGGAGETPSLQELAVRYGSDKWGSTHWYTPHYEHHFRPWQEEPVRILEIGIGGYGETEYQGGSLHMWQRYFRRGLVFGVDITEKKVSGPRIRTFQGDQNDPEFLTGLADEIGPLDIVIDDGSHVSEHILTSFGTLFPLLKPGGLYVIEDLQTSYWGNYGGNAQDVDSPLTSVGFLKTLVDGLHHQERVDRSGEPSYTEQHVTGLHFYHNICFVKKGANNECGPDWLRQFGFDPR
ncbi:class I SAM-dependent methyltransferase [Amycolatopsis sp. NPDC058986]|uniref:class I SAM-dependent methyltransferase n=1 Tax=unclassified Amycolatopsis TaxID=2618356 RepID=UPI003670CEC6